MSKYSIRLLVVAIVISAAGLVWAQKRSVIRTPTRVEEGRVASAEEPDFTRFRVVTDQGILAVFDADEEWDGRDEPYTQIAYWHDFGTEQLFFFDQLLFTPDDVLQSIAAMPRDLAIDHTLLIAEKPELGPLPGISSPGQWRPAIETDVLAVMSGGQAASAEGTISGLISPCAPNPNCDPAAAAAASSSLPAPVRGTSSNQLFAIAQAGSYCNCNGGGTPSPPPDPLRFIHPIADRLIVMDDDLVSNHFDPTICPTPVYLAEIVTTEVGGAYETAAPISLNRDGEELRTGSVSVSTTDVSDSVDMQITTTVDDGEVGPDPEWILNQMIVLEGDVLRFSGSINVVEPSGNSYTLAGGWTYSETAGLEIDPSSDPEFHQALAGMQGIEQPVVAGGVSPGQVLGVVTNTLVIVLNYLRDSLRPYTQPTSCGGPVYEDGTSLSCEAEEIPCHAILDDIALKIHNLTNVSLAFKKCMMGRFDCRGSNNRQYAHPQIRVKCTTSSLPSCGPCIMPPNSDPAIGCNLGGRHIWYCRPHDVNQTPIQNECECAEIAFHEAAHACAAQDPPFLPIDANYSSYRIGCWFLNRCYDLYPSETRTRQDVCGEDNDD